MKVKVISNRASFAEKLSVPPSNFDLLSRKAPEGLLGGSLIAVIVFILTSLSYLTYGWIFTTTVIVFAPVFIPAIITLLLSGVAITAILAYLEKFGVTSGNKKIIPMSFESRLDELGAFVWGLLFIPAIATSLSDSKINSDKKQIIEDTLVSWGYSYEWINSEFEKTIKGNPSAMLVVSKALWKEYKSCFKKTKPTKKNKEAIKKDLPSPDFLKEKMILLAQDFMAEQTAEKRACYIKNLESF